VGPNVAANPLGEQGKALGDRAACLRREVPRARCNRRVYYFSFHTVDLAPLDSTYL